MKKLIFLIVTLAIAIAAIILLITRPFSKKSDPHQLSIVTTTFIPYDLARAVTKNTDAHITMLIKPGTDIHTFEPTPQDIIAIKNADLFIYNGGESDDWIQNILSDNHIPTEKTLRLMDEVETKTEIVTPEMTHGNDDDAAESAHDSDHEHDSGSEHDSAHNSDHNHDSTPEYDEHIWTSLKNTIKLIKSVSAKLSTIAPANAPTYAANTDAYVATLTDLDQQFQNLIATSQRTTLIFADRFPFRYFTDDYGLSYSAAFPGCAEQTEASSQTIANLITKVTDEHIPVILKIELSTGNLANTIADATGAKILELHSAHNISQSDFDSGITYPELLQRNLKTLTEALN